MPSVMKAHKPKLRRTPLLPTNVAISQMKSHRCVICSTFLVEKEQWLKYFSQLVNDPWLWHHKAVDICSSELIRTKNKRVQELTL